MSDDSGFENLPCLKLFEHLPKLAMPKYNDLLECKYLGVDRVIPVGQALEIDLIWDGYDIIRSLSRTINVR